MRKYLFGTGLISSIIGGLTLLRGSRYADFTWRTALAWVSWGITLALAIGAIVDMQRAGRGVLAPAESKIHGKEPELVKKHLRG